MENVSPIYNPHKLYSRLSKLGEIVRFHSSIGSTNVTNDEYLVYNVSESDSDQSVSEADSDEILNDLFMDEQQGNINLDDILVSAAHTRPRNGIDVKHLSKIWIIDLEAAQKTLDITSQASIRKYNPSLSQTMGQTTAC